MQEDEERAESMVKPRRAARTSGQAMISLGFGAHLAGR